MTVQTLELEQLISETRISSERPTVLYGIGWEDYLAYTHTTLNRANYKMSYNRGVLKIMGQGLKHENISRFIEKLITLISLSLGQNIISAGSMTLTSKRLRKGADPDESYYIQNADSAKIKDALFDDTTDTPPDLVVEIDRSHGSDDKFEIYAAFGIKEFWLFSEEVLHIFLLSETGEYLESPQSSALPVLSAQDLTRFINNAQKGEQIRVLQDFQAWLAGQKSKTTPQTEE